MNNAVCRNFEYNEKANSILELINLNCERCEFDGHCDIETATINQIWTPDEAKAFYNGFMAGLNNHKGSGVQKIGEVVKNGNND